jgi:hypothetical protein
LVGTLVRTEVGVDDKMDEGLIVGVNDGGMEGELEGITVLIDDGVGVGITEGKLEGRGQ